MRKTRGSTTYRKGVRRYIKCPKLPNASVRYGTVGKRSDLEIIYTSSNKKLWKGSHPPWQFSCSHVINDTDVTYPFYERWDMYGECEGGYGKEVVEIDPPLSTTATLRKNDKLILEAMANAKSKGFGTYDLLQYKQTFKTISDCVFKSKRFLLKDVPGDEGKTLQHKIADRWLEYRYSLNPLLSTADQQIKNAIDRLHSHGPTYVTGKAYASDSYDGVIQMGGPYGIYNFSTYTNDNSKAICWYETGKMQLGFNPAVAIWDKIPWSFAVNWFVDVETLLWNLSPTLGFRFHSGSVSSSREVQASLDSIENTFKAKGKGRIAHNVGGGFHKARLFNRTVFYKEPSYDFMLEVCNPIKWQRCLDVLALLTGRLSRRTR
jgi:hypothetical protein